VKQNVTISLDREIVRKAKILAARRATSISGLLAAQIEAMVVEDEAYQQRSGKPSNCSTGVSISAASTTRSDRTCMSAKTFVDTNVLICAHVDLRCKQLRNRIRDARVNSYRSASVA